MEESTHEPNRFESTKRRLEEIADTVSNKDMPLDEVLDLFEEAVSLGLKASDLLEDGIRVDDAEVEGFEADPLATDAGEGQQGDSVADAVRA